MVAKTYWHPGVWVKLIQVVVLTYWNQHIELPLVFFRYDINYNLKTSEGSVIPETYIDNFTAISQKSKTQFKSFVLDINRVMETQHIKAHWGDI